MIDVIYLAAGKGVRAGLGYPKQYARIGGKPILVHGLEVLQAELIRIPPGCANRHRIGPDLPVGIPGNRLAIQEHSVLGHQEESPVPPCPELSPPDPYPAQRLPPAQGLIQDQSIGQNLHLGLDAMGRSDEAGIARKDRPSR